MLNELFHESGPGDPARGRPQRHVLLDREPLALPRPRSVRVLEPRSRPATSCSAAWPRPSCATRCAGIVPDADHRQPPQGRLQRAHPRLPRHGSNAEVRQELLSDSPIFDIVRRDAIEQLLERDRAAQLRRASSCSTSSARSSSSRSSPREMVPLVHPARHAAQSDARRRRHLQRLPQPRHQAANRLERARRGAAGRCRNGKSSGERLRLPHPGLRRQGQHLADRQMPGAWPETPRRHLAAAGAHRHRPAQPRQPDRARRRSHRLQHRPRGRAQAHAQGVRALRVDRDRHAPGPLRHPADPGGAVSHPAGGVGRELGVRIRQRRGGAHRLRARSAPGSRPTA